MNEDLPSITNYRMASNVYGTTDTTDAAITTGSIQLLPRRLPRWRPSPPFEETETENQETQAMSKENSKRIVQVFVVDLHPDAPPESAILYATDKPFLTDLTDQELYFGIDLKGRVEAYNSLRTTWKDKKATRQAGKDVFLEPLKIRELGMVVTELAKF